MKKVVSIHLNNRMFQIEEDAFAYLNHVLSGQWKQQELEAQLAEQLEQKINGNKTVVTFSDMVDVLYRLGFPIPDKNQPAVNQNTRKLYRRTDNKIIAGICTGLGEYLEIDPVILRAIFVVAFFFGSMGFWLYIILWLIVPKTPKVLNA